MRTKTSTLWLSIAYAVILPLASPYGIGRTTVSAAIAPSKHNSHSQFSPSRTRNPLYIGNLFIYSGVVLLSGGIYMFQLLAIVIFYFIFQYSMIISLEEEKLSIIFGQNYSNYKNNVPRIIPLIIPWDNKSKLKPIPILKTLKTEKRTLQNIFLLVFIIISKPYFLNFGF